MKCRDARELINSYIDNGLDPELDAHLMEHVKNCSKCSRELELLLQYKDAVNKIRPVKAPDNFMAELHRRIEAESGSRIRRFLNDAVSAWRHFRFPYQAAGVIAVALLIFFLYTPVFHREKAIQTIQEDQVPGQEQEMERKTAADAKLPQQAKKTAGRNYPSPSINDDIPAAKETIVKESADKNLMLEGRVDEEKKEYRSEENESVEGAAGAYSAADTDTSDMVKQSMAKSKSSTEFSKKADIMPAFSTPEMIFSEYGASVKKREVRESGNVLYVIEVRESVINSLTDKIKKGYTASIKEISRKDGLITAEFLIRKKSQ